MANARERQPVSGTNIRTQLQMQLQKLPGYRDSKLAYCIDGLTPLIENDILTLEQALQIATTRFARIETLMSKAIDSRSAYEDPRVVGQKAAKEFISRRLPRVREVTEYLLERQSRKNLEDQS